MSSGVCLAQRPASLAFRTAVTRDSVSNHPPDSFTGPDKVKHFLMSGFIETMAFSSLQGLNADRSVALGAATAATLGIGIAREMHDRRTKGLFSLGDLMWDGLGIASALLLISHIQR